MVQSLPSSSASFLLPPTAVAPLPHLVLEHEHAPLNVSWPRVSAGPSATQVTAQRGKKLDPSPAGALLDALDELLGLRDPQVALRTFVELCQQRLGLRQPALLLVDETGEFLCGSWRASVDGSLIDERTNHLKLGLLHRQAETSARERAGSWTVFSEAVFPHIDPKNLRPDVPAWTVLTPIFGRNGLIGFLENVGEYSDGAPHDAVQTRAALLCRALGGLLDDIGRRARGLPWDSLLARKPVVPTTLQQSRVERILLSLFEDPGISSQKLAAQLGVSTPHLSTIFHEQMGLSLTKFRNRLRIELFFTHVDPSGGNLLQAAFQAGFGSYPQFHRVFRELLDATPRDYLIPLG